LEGKVKEYLFGRKYIIYDKYYLRGLSAVTFDLCLFQAIKKPVTWESTG
jgi:hypothetical protein